METTLIRLGGLLEQPSVTVGDPRRPSAAAPRSETAGGSWWSLSALADDALLARWTALAAARSGQEDVASSFLGGWLAAPVTRVWAAAILTETRSLVLDPVNVLLHRNPGGWFDGVAFVEPAAVVLATDPSQAGPARPGARVAGTVPGAGELIGGAADELVRALAPVLAAMARVGRFGLRGLWGNGVADPVLDVAAELTRRGVIDPESAESAAGLLLDAIDERAPVSLPRPRWASVPFMGTDVPFAVKGTCCLLYRTVPPDRRDTGDYCTGCPLVDDRSRVPRWTAWLHRISGR